MSEKAEKSYWSGTYRIGTHRVYAWERLDRGGLVFVKYSSPDKRGRDRREKAKLPGDYTVRDAKGRLDKKRLRDVEAAVYAFATPLLIGKRPTPAAEADGPLTLSEGFERALDIGSGKYPTKSARWQEVKRARAKLERMLGVNTAMAEIKPGDVRRVWRTLAAAFARRVNDHAACGVRQTEVTVDALYSVASWLREEGELPPDALLPIPKWRAKLKTDWEQITETSVAPDRPRHTDDEMRRLFRHMHDPRVDPRFALAFDLGGEQRMGQVLRCQRSQLELPAVDHARLRELPAGQLGLARIRGSGKKSAMPVVLTADQRVAIEAALMGYLADFELAWRSGQIADYPLFPAGRFKKGKARVVAGARPLTRDAALKMFYELEQVAGVSHIPGRGWYGVRRVATDLAENVEKDERVLNSITGHRDSTTRRLVYQDSERSDVLIRAAEVRAEVRGAEPKGSAAGSPTHARSA